MLAFHSDLKIKNKYLNRIIAHQKADNLIRGTGWENGKGCAVGCTLEDYDHSKYPIELGIPEWLGRVEDQIFEGMSLEKSKTFPEIFLKSIKPGVDLEKAKLFFILVILNKNLKTLNSLKIKKKDNIKVFEVIKNSKKVIKQMIKAQISQDIEELSAARSAAWSAASAAWSAAASAASAASAAWSAAWSAASAASAAWSAASAASAAWSAAWSAASAASAAESKTFDFFADELIKIFKSLK